VLKVGILLVNVARFPVLRQQAPDPGPPAARGPDCGPDGPRPPASVSMLVPVRNEAAVLPASITAMLRQGADELILLDDQSDDGSGPVARSLMAAEPRARVVSGRPAPRGWVGKSWACDQLAAAASGSVLMFCDADIMLADGAAQAVLAEMRRQDADVFSVFPRQVTATLGEHLLTPLIDDVLLCFLPFGLLSAPVPAAATANGSLLVFTRQAYDDLGGFAAVRGEIVEDVALARLTRRAGLKLGLVLGGELVLTRMYDGYREACAGMARGLLPVTGGSRSRLILGAAWHLLAYTLPCAVAVRRRAWLLPLSLGVAERVLVEIKTERRAVWQAVLTPLVPLTAVPVVVQALRRNQRWKGRACS
jgi:Glycosyl transferase family 21